MRFCRTVLFLCALRTVAAADVRIADADATATISNGVLEVKVDKANGRVVSMRRNGLELLATRGAQGIYWNPAPAHGEYRVVSSTPERAEVSVKSVNAPVDLDVHYALMRDDSALYCWMVMEHRAEYPRYNIGEARTVVKLNPAVFDFLTIDKNRQRQMITGADWVAGKQMNMKEARLMTTGIHKGEVEHKYDYSAVLGETPAYGWSSTKDDIGIWIVNPTVEYLNCGPVHPELTGHIDLKDNADDAVPLLLNMWHGSHYGSRPLILAAGEQWKKVIGPFLVHTNGGGGHQQHWKDALSRAAKEQQAWPYAWVHDAAYPPESDRGAVAGQLVLRDPQAANAKLSHVWVGLAYPDSEWQTESKRYQYWTRADESGRFTIRHARPGTYTLYAIADGVLGDFSKADVTVSAGKTLDLKELTWTPVRYGRQIWEIGIPDRTAGEFRHGDDYWHWGIYNLYPKEFPEGVHYVIGKSDPRRDWNYAQIGTKPWTIEFEMPSAPQGEAILRLAICGVRGDRVRVAVNGQEAGDTGRLPDSGVMHRDGIRGYWLERDINFPASLLKPGTNKIELQWDGRTWVNGVMYDYVRLELKQ